MPSRDTPTPLIYTATAMYELSIERDFVGAHAITMAGECEESHVHTWHVTVIVAGAQLDADGLLCDFHLLQRGLAEIVARFDDGDLNTIAPFDQLNPTAEHLAQYIAQQMIVRLPHGVALKRVSVTEAPGCCATYIEK